MSDSDGRMARISLWILSFKVFEATNKDVRMSRRQVALLTWALRGALHWSFPDGMRVGEAVGILTPRDLPQVSVPLVWTQGHLEAPQNTRSA